VAKTRETAPRRFTGWPPEAFAFYAGLEADNSRSFWLEHKPVYESAVKQPFALLSEAVAASHSELLLFRPHRDVRFSKDKSPYKTAAGALGEREGGATYYVQLSAEGLMVGAGMYDLASDQLERFRSAVLDDDTGPELAAVAERLEGAGYALGALHTLKTAPRGIAKDHPRIGLLRRKGLIISRSFPKASWMHTPKALDRILGVWVDAEPLQAWLERHVGPSTLPPAELGR
jgi:uncharacterized protein (TIGR02453 family)